MTPDLRSLTDFGFGVGGLIILVTLGFLIFDERRDHGRWPVLWFVAVVFLTPLGLATWYFVASRDRRLESRDVDIPVRSVTLGVSLLAALGVLYLSGRTP